MAEPIGIASGVLALAIAAFQASKYIHDGISSYRGRKTAVQDFTVELDGLMDLLTIIKQQAADPDIAPRLVSLQSPLRNCLSKCEDISSTLKACKENKEGEERNDLAKWIFMEYNGKRFDNDKRWLESYKMTLQIAFAVVNMQNGVITQDLLSQLLRSSSATVETLRDQETGIIESIQFSNHALQEFLTQELQRLQGSIRDVEMAQRMFQATQPSVIIRGNEGGDGSHTLFGTDNQKLTLNLSVEQNKAGKSAVMAAGVHSPATIQALLSQRPAVASVMQGLQMGTFTTSFVGAQLMQSSTSVDASDRQQPQLDYDPEARRNITSVGDGDLEEERELEHLVYRR